MCEYKLKAAHSLDARHDVDKQGLLTICFGVLAELLLEGRLRRQGAEDASSESSGLGFEPEGLETELDDIIKILPGVDGVRAGPLNRNGDDLVAADEVLGQTVARLAGHWRLGKKRRRSHRRQRIAGVPNPWLWVCCFRLSLAGRLQFCRERALCGSLERNHLVSPHQNSGQEHKQTRVACLEQCCWTNRTF